MLTQPLLMVTGQGEVSSSKFVKESKRVCIVSKMNIGPTTCPIPKMVTWTATTTTARLTWVITKMLSMPMPSKRKGMTVCAEQSLINLNLTFDGVVLHFWE